MRTFVLRRRKLSDDAPTAIILKLHAYGPQFRDSGGHDHCNTSQNGGCSFGTSWRRSLRRGGSVPGSVSGLEAW